MGAVYSESEMLALRWPAHACVVASGRAWLWADVDERRCAWAYKAIGKGVCCARGARGQNGRGKGTGR